MAADAAGRSQAEKNIFKGCYRSANCSSSPDNPLTVIFLLYGVLPYYVLGELIWLLCPAIQTEQVRGVVRVDLSQHCLFTKSLLGITAQSCSSQVVPCLSPVVCPHSGNSLSASQRF